MIFDRLFSWIVRRAITRESFELSGIFDDAGGGTYAGEIITPSKALKITAVLACVRLIGESIASLPLKVYRRNPNGDGAEEAVDHPAYDLIHAAPNAAHTSFTLRQYWLDNCLLWGNAYGHIPRNPSGSVREIEYLPADVTMPLDGGRFYETHKNGVKRIFPAREIIHVPGMPGDGVEGASVIEHAANTIWTQRATDEFGARFFSEGAMPGLQVKIPKGMPKELKKEIEERFRKRHSGKDKAFRTLMLDHGLEAEPFTMIPGKDAQLIEMRHFGVEDIARAFRVPPYMIGVVSAQPRANIEQEEIDFVKHTLAPWLTRFEQEFNRKLVSRPFYVEFNVDGLLRGDSKTRAEVDTLYVQNGIYNRDEVRKRYNLAPIPGGDQYTVQMQMVPVDEIGVAPTPVNAGAAGGSGSEATDGAGDGSADEGDNSGDGRADSPSGRAAAVAAEYSAAIARRLRERERAAFRQSKKADFAGWLEKFLRDHTGLVASELEPLIRSLGADVQEAADLALSEAVAYVDNLRCDLEEVECPREAIKDLAPSEWWDVRAIAGLYDARRITAD